MEKAFIVQKKSYVSGYNDEGTVRVNAVSPLPGF